VAQEQTAATVKFGAFGRYRSIGPDKVDSKYVLVNQKTNQ
jgi:hypothetical protein